MARPQKKGLDYFPFDCDFFNDEKIEAISGEFGIKGEITVVKLLCAIYKNGYFIQWSELYKMKLLKSLPGISPDLLDQIIKRLVLWGFFDKDLFDSASILTSKGIQVRYFEATKRRLSNNDFPYILINVNNNSVNVNNNSINVDISTQSKVKEKKVNKRSTYVDTKSNDNNDIIDVDKGKDIIFSDAMWLDSLSANLQIPVEKIRDLYGEFVSHRRESGRHEDTSFEIKAHFKNWLKIQLRNGNRPTKSDQKRSQNNMSTIISNNTNGTEDLIY